MSRSCIAVQTRLAWCVLALGTVLAAGCTKSSTASETCFPELGYCIVNGSAACPSNNAFPCTLPSTAGTTGGVTTASNTGTTGGVTTTGTTTGGGTGGTTGTKLCNTGITADDIDGDGIPNANEFGVANNSTDPNNPDTDGDNLQDGCEDKNHDGHYEPSQDETNPLAKDTDLDGLMDGTEDANHDGYFQQGETNPLNPDSDEDGILDGTEDRNHNGVVDKAVLANPLCFNPNTDTPGETDPRLLDTDGDGIPDGPGTCTNPDPNFCNPVTGAHASGEDKNANGVFDANSALHETVAFAVDSDCDGITDGLEDKNKNGWVDPGETDPRNTDSDADLIPDGTEDINHNGRWDWPAETSPILQDSDGDGIFDGTEDRNHNGVVDAWGGTGCFAYNSNQGESDPRKVDTDGDGLPDAVEDRNQNGLCDVYQNANLTNPTVFTETCAFLADTDCDGLREGLEDKNKNGSVDTGETDPKRSDSDFDQLTDGCPTGGNGLCEDKNNNGVVDPGETDPTQPDTDGDYESDGCELTFAANGATSGPTKPLVQDTDGDGYPDGDEDANHNCKVDPGETDPRVFNGPPSASTPCVPGSGPLNSTSCLPQFDVCSPGNLGELTFAASNRVNQDYQVALEEEKLITGPCGSGGTCVSGETCVGNGGGNDGNCVLSAPYTLAAFGKDIDGGGFSANDPNDALYGWAFESPAGIIKDPSSGITINRDIYGFVFAAEDANNLTNVINNVVNSVTSHYSSQGSVTQLTGTLPQQAYDSLPADPQNGLPNGYPIYFAQQPLSLSFVNTYTALAVRNDLLVNLFLHGVAPQPTGTPPTVDPVYGNQATGCTASTPHCYSNFTLYIGAVQRTQQPTVATGKNVTLYVVALTPNDSDSTQANSTASRLYSQRVTRLEDLTGGASVAQYSTGLGKACDGMPQTLARADMLWVVDDSRSMQQIIQKLNLAASTAEPILTANANIVDFRVAMTTTNASRTGRTQCITQCDETCNNGLSTATSENCAQFCADQSMGCIKACPSDCTTSGCNGTTDVCSSCSNCQGYDVCSSAGTCFAEGNLAAAIAADPALVNAPNGEGGGTFPAFQLPGGGGTFYYESTYYMDCVAECGTFDQNNYLNHCNQPLTTQMAPFYASNGAVDKALLSNAGWHGPSGTTCPTAPLDLYYRVVEGDSTQPNYPPTCNRLIDACTDGPTVLASQMCDLIRGMGGVPSTDLVNQSSCLGANPNSSSARRHSAPEHGSRSARRLYTNLWAYPYDDTAHVGPGTMRLNCSVADSNCKPCQVTPGSTCDLVPNATIFLSDEEDFFFKDDCMDQQALADKAQLPNGCIYNGAAGCTVSYCSQFTDGVPTGTNHDQTAWNDTADYTLQWGNQPINFQPNPYIAPTFAPECSIDPSAGGTTCIQDPCPFYTSQAACTGAPALAHCEWLTSYPNLNGNTTVYNPYNNAQPGGCINHCSAYVVNTAANPGRGGNAAAAAAQQTACQGDPLCLWDGSQVTSNGQGPYDESDQSLSTCVMAAPINDCRACKRYTRLQQSLVGDGTLVGLQGLGPVTSGGSGKVYAITRQQGKPGMGYAPSTPVDECQGAPITWGRGDGQAYRDLAQQTGGQYQDICAPSYQDFMEQLTADLATLSRAYPLSSQPIPATIEVGVARQVNSSWTYIPVPRSDSQGFLYDSTNNSIGFKSDPVLGVCGSSACASDTTITSLEIQYAQQLPFIPHTGDLVYVSYKVWEPPTHCPAGEEEARITCQVQQSSSACSTSADCSGGYSCESNQCTLTCTPGTLVNVCIPEPNCGSCETWDSTSRSCVAAAACCNTTGQQSCNPQASGNTCPIGMACDETCVCSQIASCTGVTFGKDGTVNNCPAAIKCCDGFSAASATCSTYSNTTTCTADANCRWPGACSAKGSTSVPCSGYDETTCNANSSACTWTASPGASCQYRYQTCCPSADTVSCYTDTETGAQALACLPQACSCFNSSGVSICASRGSGYVCDPTQNCQCVSVGN